MAPFSWLTCLLVFGAIFEIRPTSGPPRRGEILRLDDKNLAVKTDAGEETLALREISRVTRIDTGHKLGAVPLPITLHLTDGSLWRLAGVKLESGKLEAKDAQGAALAPRIRAVAALRLRIPEGYLDAAWEEYVAAKRATDALIIRRTVKRKSDDGETVIESEITLDEIEGKLVEIGDAAVKFEVEGEPVDIAREKVEGVVLAIAAGGEEPEMTCLAVDETGSRWKLQSLALEKGVFKLTSVSGVTCDLPLEQLTMLDFSASNTRYLSDLEFASTETRSYLDASFTGDKLQKLLAPRKDIGAFGGKLEGGDPPFEEAKGLALVAYSRVQFRVPKGFTRFAAIAALDPHVKKIGGVKLRILVDDREVYAKLINGAASGDPINLELPAQPRMLTIEADFGPRKELGASLQLQSARFGK